MRCKRGLETKSNAVVTFGFHRKARRPGPAFTRLTNMFSTKVENREEAVVRHYIHYNSAGFTNRSATPAVQRETMKIAVPGRTNTFDPSLALIAQPDRASDF
jgi:hypothetical protein